MEQDSRLPAGTIQTLGAERAAGNYVVVAPVNNSSDMSLGSRLRLPREPKADDKRQAQYCIAATRFHVTLPRKGEDVLYDRCLSQIKGISSNRGPVRGEPGLH